MKTATQPQTSKPTRPSSAKSVGRLFFLEASGGRIHSANADGSDRKVIVSGARVPDGIVVDVEAGHIYWTNMGIPTQERRLDRARGPRRSESQDHRSRGRHVHAKAAPSREEERQTLLVRPRRNARDAREPRWIEHRNPRRHKPRRRPPGNGRNEGGASGSLSIRTADKSIGRKKAPITRERAESSALRSTSRKVRRRRIGPISKLLFDGLPEPIDLELDLKNRLLYWTDRGDPPRGNTVNRASLDADFNKHPGA